MNTKFKKTESIIESFNALFESLSEKEKLDNEAKIIMFRFLEIVERKREEMGWTRKQLAEKIGTSASYITQLYRGDKLANLPFIAKVQMKLCIQFEISERESYDEQIRENADYRIPLKHGLQMDKNCIPQYDTDIQIPHFEQENQAA
jgi:ribosome-binding protein aMBF1 (putative translation factor)